MFEPPDPGMRWLARIALAAAVVSALLLARRRREYVPTAAFLIWVGLCHIVRPALHVFVLGPAREAGRLPYVGWERVTYHVGEQALFISWPFALAALAVWTFWKRRPWPVALVWVVTVAGLAMSYPMVRRELLHSVYLASSLVGLAISIGAVAFWWRKASAPATTPPEAVALLLTIFEVALLAGPYAAGSIFTTWPIAYSLYFAQYAAITGVQFTWLRRLLPG